MVILSKQLLRGMLDCLLLVAGSSWCETVGAIESRVGNATLSLPQQPPVNGFQAVDAFPGLSFVRPVAIVSAPGETNRLFVVEKGGQIFVITNLSAPDKTLFVDLGSKVLEQWYNENGLLGLAFHPLYRANSATSSNYFYVFYTVITTTGAGSGAHERLARFDVNPSDPNQGLIDSELPLISQLDEAAGNHNAGDVHFGPDGYLYVSTGDEGGGEDAFNNSRFINKDFFSAILRLDVDQRPGSLAPNPHPSIHTNEEGEAHYRIPPDNPFLGATSFNGQAIDPATVRTEFWAAGLRNPWRMSFDPVTGLLYCGDVGQYQIEEIDIITRGRDYGWNYKEGFGNFRGIPAGTVTEADLTAPIVAYSHANGQVIPGGKAEGSAVTGGIVYRGDKYPELYGHYIFGDSGSGRIFALRYQTSEVSGLRQLATTTAPVAFGRNPANGDVLIAHFENFGGRIERLIYSEDPLPGDSLPPTLADTGAFSDLVSLTPEPGIVAYDLNTPFWSDHAGKHRWFSVPDTNLTIAFSPTGNWFFPTGTVWIKHFELELTNGVPESARRLETRFLVRNPDGVYGVTYRWGDLLTNAFLVGPEGMDEEFVIHEGGILRTQVWHYPSRTECARCHTPAGGLALGFSTAQLNRSHDYAGAATNQLLALSAAGYFEVSLGDTATLPALAPATDEASSVTHRVRSYLAANCAQCHQPGGGTQGIWDARFATPLLQAGIVDGPLVNPQGDPNNRVIKPGSLAGSMILTRLASLGAGHMPPLATSELNHEAIALLSRWITNELVSLSIALATNQLDYQEGAGSRILDGAAVLTSPDLGSLAGTSLTISLGVTGTALDRLGLQNVGTGPGAIGVLGTVITFGGVPVGEVSGGTDGFTQLVVSFGTNSTFEAAQAVLRHLTFANFASNLPSSSRTVEFTLETFYGASSLPALLTIELSALPPLATEFTGITLEDNGQLRLTFSGQAGWSYRVEFSTDLKAWHLVTNIQTDGSGLGTYSGAPRMTNEVTGFYRVAWP